MIKTEFFFFPSTTYERNHTIPLYIHNTIRVIFAIQRDVENVFTFYKLYSM